jgi:hypothetical protein
MNPYRSYRYSPDSCCTVEVEEPFSRHESLHTLVDIKMEVQIHRLGPTAIWIWIELKHGWHTGMGDMRMAYSMYDTFTTIPVIYVCVLCTWCDTYVSRLLCGFSQRACACSYAASKIFLRQWVNQRVEKNVEKKCWHSVQLETIRNLKARKFKHVIPSISNMSSHPFQTCHPIHFMKCKWMFVVWGVNRRCVRCIKCEGNHP